MKLIFIENGKCSREENEQDARYFGENIKASILLIDYPAQGYIIWTYAIKIPQISNSDISIQKYVNKNEKKSIHKTNRSPTL